MDYKRVDSSSIEAVAYEHATHTLGVRFHDGRQYIYCAVSDDEYRRFLAADSLGRHFVYHIRNAGYEFHRIR